MTAAAAAPPADVLDPTGFSSLLLNLSVSGVLLMRPRYEASGELVDFDGVRLNPAAQQMLRLPECPAKSFLTLYPTAQAVGVFDFYREAFLSDTVARRQNLYQLDGLDGYYLLVAQRYQDLLVVSFTDTNDQPRSAVEDALRESQAAEQAARAEAEHQRLRFYEVLMQLPATVAVYHGPTHAYQFVNARYQRIFPLRSFAGRPFRDAMPESVGLGMAALFDQVYQRGEPFHGHEVEGWFDFDGTGERQQLFFNLYLHPLRNARGEVDGLLDFAYDVTEQVRARQQVEQLNQELETRVAERTQAALALQADVLAAAQRQMAEREAFYQVFEQTPAAICIQRGPEHRYAYANQAYRDFFPGRLLLGQPVAEALPETVDSGVVALLDRVYQTGESYEGTELPLLIAQPQGPPKQMYFTFTYQPYRENGEVVGISTFAYNAAEQVLARREREAQQQQLERLFLQAPAAIAILGGPGLVYELVNPVYQRMFPGRDLPGHALADVFPELAGTGVVETFEQVYETGLANEEKSILIPLLNPVTGQVEDRYFNYIQQARRDVRGRIDGVLVFAFEVSEQVRARQQVEQLNADLEARVQERTQQLTAAQTAAEHERARLQAVFAQAPVAIGLFAGEELRVTSANAAILTLWGRTPEQVMGRPLLEALPELQGQGFEDLLRHVLHTQVPFIGTETPALLRRAGQLHTTYFNFVYQPLYEADGQVTDVLCLAVDVTEQVLARQQVEQLNVELEARVQERTETALALQADLLEAAQRQVQMREAFYQVFEQTTAAVALLRGPDHRYEYVNSAYRGFAPHRPLVGGTIAEELPELYAQGFGALLDRVYQTGETYFGVELPFTPDPRLGEAPRTSYFNFTYQAYRENKEIAGVSIFAFEVTEQVLARRAREAQQQLVSLVFEQAPLPVFVATGPTFVLEVINAQAARLFHKTRAQLLGLPYADAFPEFMQQGFGELLRDVWQSGQARTFTDVPVYFLNRPPGEPGYFTFVYQPLRDAQGQVHGIVCVGIEVTDQVVARQQVQDLNEELAAINEELTATNEELHTTNTQLTRTNIDLDTFVYTASHDLKAPITNIESIVLALRSTLPAMVQQDEVVAHLLGLLDTTVARFQFTIGQLTDISRLQLAQAGPAEPVRLAQVIENVCLDLEPAIAAADTQLTIEVAPELVVSFSPSNLRSIVYNLLSNAIKYRAPDRPSQVLVRAEQTEAAVVLTVQDNGLGMSELQQRQLFGLFQRLHTHVEGTGVGLYISKRLVENGGGRIMVQSQVDAGTTFIVTFPA